MNVFHAGHSGDIIYCLPFLKAFCRDDAVDFYIASDMMADLPEGMNHPNGKLMMTQASFDFLKPLLESLPCIKAVHYVPSEQVPESFRLDFYRTIPINPKAGSIVDWLRKFFGLQYNSTEQWLYVNPISAAKPVILGFSRRYRNLGIDYSILKDVQNLFFVGLEDEFEWFRDKYQLNNLTHYKTANALELAKFIASAKLFIGNQSLSFAIAEALKVPRALEVYEPIPNVIPTGNGAADYFTQMAFQNILAYENLIPLNLPTNEIKVDFHLSV